LSYSAELAFKMRQEFGTGWLEREFGSDALVEPILENSFASDGVFELVGHGRVTNEKCGTFSHFVGCVNKDLHNKTVWIKKNGVQTLVNCSGKAFVRKVFCSCGKPSCPKCYKYGWAVREARRIAARLEKASLKFGLVEHIVASVPVRDYGLEHSDLRRKVDKILKARGVHGVKIFHGFRYDYVKLTWYFSPHFHVLGFVLGGYRCRGCKDAVCIGKGNFNRCEGFEAVTRQLWVNDGYIVKVLAKRKTVVGTAWYQLNHASIKKGVKRFHVATWFGVCSYRKLKVTIELKKRVCPICGRDLVKLRYCGRDSSVLDCFGSEASLCKEFEFLSDLEDAIGLELWCVDNRHGWNRHGWED